MAKKNYAIRYVAGLPPKKIFSSELSYSLNQDHPGGELFAENRLRVTVWNIHKQQHIDWLSELKDYAKTSHLLLLQEAQTTPELVEFATTHYLAADQVPAFVLPDHPSGVMTLSTANPIYCCPLRQKEPLIRLNKSALVSIYPTSNRLPLMVVNIHAVNFSLGVYSYNMQLQSIGKLMSMHQGPVIFAGDFNAWSKQRKNTLFQFAKIVGLKEVNFSFDQRKRAFGYPLDFIFYRGLTVTQAQVPITNSSDHNPLMVEFTNTIQH